MEVVRREGDFEARRERLKQRLVNGQVGYESARRASRRWLEEAQRSLGNAKQFLGNHHNLMEPGSTVVERTSIDAELDDWWRSGPEVATLIGDEGRGKSWAVLDWVGRLGTDGSPLTVFIQPRDIYVEDARRTVARQLAVQTGALDETFWQRRLLLWERSERAEVGVLVLVDGLNENHQFKGWSQWLQPLTKGDMSGIYRVAMSCWPPWWRDTLYGLPDLLPTAREVEVVEFTDGELAQLLAAMNVKRREFPELLIQLMRVPRLAALVFKHKDELKDCGDVTAERVVYMDWRDRLERRGVLAGASDGEMRQFLAHVGRDLDSALQTMTRRDVIEALSDSSGKTGEELVPAIEALSSGEWLQPGEEPHTFKLDRERVPYVLGAPNCVCPTSIGTIMAMPLRLLLSANAPDVALDLYRVMMESPGHGIASRRQFELLTFGMPRSSGADEVCSRVLATSWRDSALMEVVCAASNSGRVAWVLEKVREFEASESAGDIATAYALLGCCDESEEVDATWDSFRRRPPSDQWLRDVLRKSMGDYVRNKDAREAFREFWSTGDPADARPYLKVVEAKCDARIPGWLDEIRPGWKAQPYDRRVMFGFAVRSLNKAVKRDTDRRKRQLFHTRIGFEDMAPWGVVPNQSLAEIIAKP